MTRHVEIVILGSSGGVPTLSRRLPAVLVTDWYGYTVLLDAGEGVQYALLGQGRSPARIDSVLITHAHGDHINGLPGLLQSMYMMERRRPLLIAGPQPVIEFVRDVLEVERYNFGFPIALVELPPEGSLALYQRGGDMLKLSWSRACHTVDARAYRLEWMLRPRVDPKKASQKLQGRLELVGRLLEEGSIRIGGKTVTLNEVVAEPPKSVGIVYTGDTSQPCGDIMNLSRNARVLIHDATFDSTMEGEARERGHSTAAQAAQVARAVGAHVLILTHISARYEGRAARRLLEEAAKVFPRVLLAWDGLRLRITL